MVVYIKNMVCPRCVTSVKTLLEHLAIPYDNIKLGQVDLINELDNIQEIELKNGLSAQGFELIEDKQKVLVENIKVVLIELIQRQSDVLAKFNVSAYLEYKLHKDYKSLSAIFSASEGNTIESFVIAQKVEKVKELLSYNELNISEIAEKLHYSSVAHLSNQFKKMVGMSPSSWKSTEQARNFIDKLL